MSVRIDKLKNAPEWMNNVRNLDNASFVIKALRKKQEKALTQDEIVRVSQEKMISRVLLDSLVDVNVLSEKGGHYYIENEKRAGAVVEIVS